MKTSFPLLANTLFLLAIAAVCTYWYLQWASARKYQEPLVATPAGDLVAYTQPLDTSAAAGLFGVSASVATSAIRLVGVIAEGGEGRGVALLSVGGEAALAYKAGEPIDANLTLAEVRADRIVVRSDSGVREVRMPERPPPSGIEPVQ